MGAGIGRAEQRPPQQHSTGRQALRRRIRASPDVAGADGQLHQGVHAELQATAPSRHMGAAAKLPASRRERTKDTHSSKVGGISAPGQYRPLHWSPFTALHEPDPDDGEEWFAKDWGRQ